MRVGGIAPNACEAAASASGLRNTSAPGARSEMETSSEGERGRSARGAASCRVSAATNAAASSTVENAMRWNSSLGLTIDVARRRLPNVPALQADHNNASAASNHKSLASSSVRYAAEKATAARPLVRRDHALGPLGDDRWHRAIGEQLGYETVGL